MKKPQNNIAFTFEGRSSRGRKEYSILSGSPIVRSLLAGFARDCSWLDGCTSYIIHRFLSIASEGAPARMIEDWGEDFLMNEESLFEWLLFWKRLPPTSPGYLHLRYIHIAIYVTRYCLDRDQGRCTLSRDLVEMIRGAEFATFINKEWSGTGIVGVAVTSDRARRVVKEFRFLNLALARIYCDYFESGIATIRICEFGAFSSEFEESLGHFAPEIRSYGDFSGDSLLQQAVYFRRKYASNRKMVHKALRHVVGFYRFLVGTEGGCGIFDGGLFSSIFLSQKVFIEYLSEGWGFINYRDLSEDETRSRLVVILKELSLGSTRFLEGEAIGVDLSMLESDLYRNLVWRYILSKGHKFGCFRTLPQTLAILEKHKKRTATPLSFLTCEDAQHIKDVYLSQSTSKGRPLKESTIKLAFSSTRQFFSWAQSKGYIDTEGPYPINCIVYRTQPGFAFREPKSPTLEDYRAIVGYFRKEGQQSYFKKLVYTIVSLLAKTNMRPSQICSLSISSISFSEAEGRGEIRSFTKTSRGSKVKTYIGSEAYRLLMDVINESDEMREQCFDPCLRDCVFLYKASSGFSRIREQEVKAQMQKACQVLGMSTRWTPYSLRRLHATLWDKIDSSWGYHGELAAQGMNQSRYRTTLNHYIDKTSREFKRLPNARRISTDEMMAEEYKKLVKEGKL